jgi:flagellar hook protein FlgE
MAIQGAGFFVVSDSGGNIFLTRNGSFVPDASGNLVNTSGYYLMGSNIQNGTANVASNSLADLEKVNVTSAGDASIPTTTGTFTANLPATAAVVDPSLTPVNNSSNSTYTSETSLVTYDNLGASHTINLYFSNLGGNQWEVDAYDSAAAATGGGFPYSSGPLASQTVTFDPTTGALSSGSPLSIGVPNGQTMSLDLAKTTQLASSFSVTQAVANGNPPGSLTGVTVSTTGVLSFQFGNGTTSPAYDIPLANVASPNNLTAVTGNAFQANSDSGAAQVGSANVGGLGTIASSSLEGSTVDLATELTDMIQAQSAYEANSKVFQTGATLLDVLNNLKP